MDAALRIKLAIARDQLEHWMLRFLKGIELSHRTDLFVDRVDFWAQIMRMNGYEPFPGARP